MPVWLSTFLPWLWEARFVLAFALMHFAVRSLSTRLVARTEAAVDALAPERLRQDASTWTRQRLDDLGLSEVALASGGEAGTDAYEPAAKTIHLSTQSFGSHAVTSLAIAAHEVGHALNDARHPVLGRLAIWLRDQRVGLTLHGATLLLLNTVYRSALADRLASIVFVLAAVAHLVVLAEELLATRTARQLLDDDGQITRNQRGLAMAYLWSALGTYLATTALSCASVWIAWRLAAVIEARPARGLAGALSGHQRGFALGCAAVLVVSSLLLLRETVYRLRGWPIAPRSLWMFLHLALRLGAALGLAGLLWDVPLGTFHAERVMLAALPFALAPIAILALVALPVAYLLGFLVWFFLAFFGSYVLPSFGVYVARLPSVSGGKSRQTVDEWVRAGGRKWLADETPVVQALPPGKYHPSWTTPATELAWLACTWPLLFAFGQHLLR